MNKLFWLLGVSVMLSLSMYAQNKTIKGTVTDSLGAPVKGVSVFAKASKRGTQTDANGNFSITVNNSPTTDLIFSNVGYKTRIITTDGSQVVKVSLSQEISIQDEVVVVGYGTVRRRDLTSSVSSVSAKDLKDIPINSTAEALSGRLAGVQVTTAEGSPDADVKIRVRGGGSITQTNDPLYVIDGVIVENGLNTISPQDIQTLDVLKDAAATAIYGARGANGVVIVTTKSGRPGRLQIGFNSSIGIKKLAKTLDVMDPYNFVLFEYERTRGNAADSTTFAKNYGSYFDTLTNYKNASPVNWQKQVMGNTGLNVNNNLTLSGGNKAVTFSAGYTNNYEKAIVQNSTYRRNLLNAKVDYKVTSKLKVGGSARYTDQTVLGAGVSDDKGSSYNRLRNSVKFRPFLLNGLGVDQFDPSTFDPTVGNGLSLINPIRLNNAEYRKKTTNAYNLAFTASYMINKRFSFKTTVGYEYTTFIDRQFSDSITPLSVIQGASKPVVELDTTHKKQITNSNVFTYKNTFRKRHDVDALVGEETLELKSDVSTNLYKSFPTFIGHDDAFKQPSTLGTFFTGYPKFTKADGTLLSFFSRVNYSLDKKYLFSFNFRADGSSKFDPSNRWGYFPSGSFAWRISKEHFMENIKPISDLKIRLGYGSVGNNRINDYLYLTNFSPASYYYGLNGVPVFGYSPVALANQKLKWETTVNKNLGLDISFLHNRFNLTADYYENNTKDLLLSVPIDLTYGYPTQLQNIGSTKNKGVELQLSAVVIRNKNFTWNASFNISSNKNTITALGVNQVSYLASAGWGVAGQPSDYIVKVGEPVGAMYGLVTDGFYKVEDFDYNAITKTYALKAGVVTDASIIGNPQPGMIKFKDLDGDGKVDLDHDRKIIGNATPKFSGGLNQQFNYKNWDMSVFVNFVYGDDIYNANKIEFTNGYTPNSNLLAIMNDRWRTVNDKGVVVTDPVELAALNVNAKIWRPIPSAGAFYPHSWAIEDGSFLRINNVSIGYNIPSGWLKRTGIRRLRAYATANNLAVFTSYTGYDPEVNVKRLNPVTPNVDYSAYPKSRSYLFGINASF